MATNQPELQVNTQNHSEISIPQPTLNQIDLSTSEIERLNVLLRRSTNTKLPVECRRLSRHRHIR